MQPCTQQAGTSSEDALVASVLALPPPLASRIAATAEALHLLDFCTQFPVDCRLVAQAMHRASLLGRVQRETACAAPLCVLIDMAALQRRPGVLAGCLLWLLRLPNLRAVCFANGGKGSTVGVVELSLLLQLVAAHPQAADSLRHLGIYGGGLGWHFDAGVLAPLSNLQSLGLVWYCSADLAGLPPSVRSVEMQLPGNAFKQAWLRGAQAVGVPEAVAQEQLEELYQPLQAGLVNPLAAVPSHHLKELIIDADGLSLYLNASQLFGAAEAVQLQRAGTVQLRLPLPDHSQPWKQLLQRVRRAGGMAANPCLTAQLFAFALLDAFRPAAGLKTAQLCAQRWALQLPFLPDGHPPPAVHAAGAQPLTVIHVFSPDGMLHAVNTAFGEALGQFGRLRATDSKLVDGELQLSLRRSRVGATAIRTCGLVGGALANLSFGGGMLAGLGSLAALAGRINLPLGRTLGATYALTALFWILEEQEFDKLLLRHS